VYDVNSNSISIVSAVLAQLTAECPYTTQWATLPSQNCPFPWGIWTPSTTWFLGPNRVLNLNGSIAIGSAVLQGTLLRQTDRPKDHATHSVTIGCIYVRSTAMRPNNVQYWLLIQQGKLKMEHKIKLTRCLKMEKAVTHFGEKNYSGNSQCCWN